MKAETITLTLTIRPSYASAESVKQEVQDSLDWLAVDHHAVMLTWGADGSGEWPDDEETA